MPSILLTKRQAEVCPFPPTSSVSILDQGHVISRGEVMSVLLNMNPSEILYSVKTAASTEEYVSQDKLRFQVGCNVKVRCCSVDNVSPKSMKMESLEGVVLGTCEIPADDDRHDCAFPHKNFWYSIQVIGTSFANRILHKIYPDDVTLGSISVEDAPIKKEDSAMPIKKGSDFIQEKVKKIKVLNINIICKKNHTSCQLKIGCCENSVKQESTTKESMKRKLDVFQKHDLSAAIKDDSSACTLVPDVDIYEEDNETYMEQQWLRKTPQEVLYEFSI